MLPQPARPAAPEPVFLDPLCGDPQFSPSGPSSVPVVQSSVKVVHSWGDAGRMN